MTALNALLISSDDSNEVHMGERVPWQKEVWAYFNNMWKARVGRERLGEEKKGHSSSRLE